MLLYVVILQLQGKAALKTNDVTHLTVIEEIISMTAQWRRKFGIGLMIATASASLLMQERVQANPSLPFTLNFEEGNLRGWQQTGTAFANQPTLGDNPTARNRGQASQHQGQYWIGGYENYQGRPGQRPGAVQGDRPQGTLTSARFRIPSGTLSFLVGGGSSPQTRVERSAPVNGLWPE